MRRVLLFVFAMHEEVIFKSTKKLKSAKSEEEIPNHYFYCCMSLIEKQSNITIRWVCYFTTVLEVAVRSDNNRLVTV